MVCDLLWVCDELAKLHQDLQAIRAQRVEQSAVAQQDAGQSPMPTTDNTKPQREGEHDRR